MYKSLIAMAVAGVLAGCNPAPDTSSTTPVNAVAEQTQQSEEGETP